MPVGWPPRRWAAPNVFLRQPWQRVSADLEEGGVVGVGAAATSVATGKRTAAFAALEGHHAPPGGKSSAGDGRQGSPRPNRVTRPRPEVGRVVVTAAIATAAAAAATVAAASRLPPFPADSRHTDSAALPPVTSGHFPSRGVLPGPHTMASANRPAGFFFAHHSIPGLVRVGDTNGSRGGAARAAVMRVVVLAVSGVALLVIFLVTLCVCRRRRTGGSSIDGDGAGETKWGRGGVLGLGGGGGSSSSEGWASDAVEND